MQAAQNQHYVPKFVLRNFLHNEAKEQFAVFDKKTDRHFVTSINNIMAERRFNEFQFEEALVSFENIAGHFESALLPVYRRILEERRLDGTDEQRAALAFLIAFQFVRTKAHRDMLVAFEEGIRQKIEAMGRKMEDLDGWQPQTEDVLKREHLARLHESILHFAPIIAQKDFVLAQAGPGRSFYLGDNPVAMHNDREVHPFYGNIGLAIKGIQIYMPLSDDLMLAAWCPSLLKQMEEEAEESKKRRRADFLGAALAGKFPIAGLRGALDMIAPLEEKIDAFLATARAGEAIASDADNMDFFNSLQVKWAHRYVICKKSDFALAKRFVVDFPHARGGFRPRFD